MLYSDLLRATVFLAAAVATALGALALAVAKQDESTGTLVLAGVWWVLAAGGGLYLGQRAGAGEEIGATLAEARPARALPDASPARVALGRLWPFAAFTLVAGLGGLLYSQVAAIGAGYAIVGALAWRRREAAVIAIEDRDGARFYVEPTIAPRPLKLVRAPGFRGDRLGETETEFA